MSKTLDCIVEEMKKHHAENLYILDFRGVSSCYDYFVIATASNPRLAWALSDYIEEKLSEMNIPIRSKEGNQASRWILIDCYEVIVHVFLEEERELYQLEKLWGDLPCVRVEL